MGCMKRYTAFLFMDHAFWKENIEDRVKLLESSFLQLISLSTMYTPGFSDML